MYTTSSHSVSAPMNGMGNELVDGSGTINPAALNSSGPITSASLPTPSTSSIAASDLGNVAPSASPRGIKRSRSEDQYEGQAVEVEVEDDAHVPRKRGRPPKTPRTSTSGAYPSPSSQKPQKQVTPQLPPQSLPQQSPPASSPPTKTTPTKPIIKALPTVRDHTSDQLGETGDEYLPKEHDEAGEKKVDAMGNLQDGRQYKCRTFCVPNRGKKLFMLATECARVLGYRDSYLLFNKNRSLYKIIATQVEKDDLIHQDILPYSYRSRQIAIVTARSMFRQFGSRVIVNGRRVRDDYWESKARKQGFTEEDLAGEKRPGAQKARDAAAAEAANAGIMPTLGHGDVIYSHNPGMDGLSQPGLPPGMSAIPASLAPLPMIHLTPADDARLREFSSIPRTRQEVTGQPYQDRTQPSTAAEIMSQASHSADFSKILNQQRSYRAKALEEQWNKPHEIPASSPEPSGAGQIDSSVAPQSLQSPQMRQQQNIISQQQTTMMTPQQAYSQPTHQQTPISQSPLRGMPQVQHRSSSLSMPSPAGQQSSYPYSQAQQLWGQPPPQPQPSPLGSHSMNMPQYTPQMHPQQTPSPHLHSTPPMHHPSQSPRHQHQIPSTQQLHGQPQLPQNLAGAGYPGVTTPGYPSMAAARAAYQQPGQQYLAGPNQQSPMGLGMGTTAALPGWPSTAGAMPPGQPQPGQPQGGWPATY